MTVGPVRFYTLYMMNIEFRINVMRLYNGRRSFYGSVRIGSRAWFLSRWDSARVTLKPGQRDIYRGAVMTWYGGVVGGTKAGQ